MSAPEDHFEPKDMPHHLKPGWLADDMKRASERVATNFSDADIIRDARRYRRLQILGARVARTLGGDTGLLRFSNLDNFLDHDLEINPSRGEAKPLPPA